MDLMVCLITHICKNEKTAESDVMLSAITVQASFFLFLNNQYQISSS